jgi:hypothetical protein
MGRFRRWKRWFLVDAFARAKHDNLRQIPVEGSWRGGEELVFDVSQADRSAQIRGNGVSLDFTVDGIELPQSVDASFAVWALLPRAMEGGFDIRINRPIDPVVAANAARLSRIWEMWVPSRYRSTRISGTGDWSRPRRDRLHRVDLYSGGLDSTYSILQFADSNTRGYALTVYGLDYKDNWDGAPKLATLVAKTDPLLEQLNYQRIVVRTNASHKPQVLTHGFTLASSLFLLSDLFEFGTMAADRTPAQDMLTFPWGTNHITKDYFAGSDFAMRSVFETSRVEKLAAIGAGKIGLPFLSFCRDHDAIPENCGRCGKCVRTKAMLMATIGEIPNIFIDNAFNEQLVRSIDLNGRERAHILSLYDYAKENGRLDAVPGLRWLVEQCRAIDAEARAQVPVPREGR